jgi:asparagine synthase (glutamine-hydrolysing)
VPEPGLSVEATAAELRLVMEEAVEKWMVADVEVGCFLSGGLDSSIIAALAARHAPYRLKTFSVGAGRQRRSDGGAQGGRPYRFRAFRARLHRRRRAEVLPKVIYHLESADIDLVRSAIPTHFAAKLARRYVKAVLTGEGADELFAGYTYHHAYVDRPRELAEELTRSLNAMHNINLQRVDRITMGESLEARTPFLDRDLIDFAQSIPATLKLCRTDRASRKHRRHDREVDPAQGLRRPAAARPRLAQEGAVRRRLGHGRHAQGSACRIAGTNDRSTGKPKGELYRDMLRRQYAIPSASSPMPAAGPKDASTAA